VNHLDLAKPNPTSIPADRTAARAAPAVRKPAILVTGTIDRPDILSMFRDVGDSAALTFVEYYFNWGIKCHPEHFEGYGPLRFWDEFRHANDLLDQLRPDRIVFFYISSLNQVALKVAAQQRGIPTLHLEHGFRQRYADSVDHALVSVGVRRRLNLAKLRREFPHIVRNHAFFMRSVPQLRPPVRQELFRYGLRSYARGLSLGARSEFGRLRQPDRYIAFSPEILEYHRVQDAMSAEDMQRVTYIGLPQFDPYCNLPVAPIDPRNVILIDHQNHSGKLYGWTIEFRHEWVRKIHETITALGLRLFVKQHPGDLSNAWAPYLDKGNVEIIDHDRLRALLPSTRLILGGFSTMQLPVTGLPHTVLITLEIHPDAGVHGSKQFIDAGVAAPVTSFEQLRSNLIDVERLAAEQSRHKAAFVEQFLHKMDGNAGARLREVLIRG
jgi:hypothetical protein